jgi:hypothetical protein
VNDELLIPMLEAADEETRRYELERLLVARAAPIVDRVLGGRFREESLLGEPEMEEIRAVINLQLVSRLQDAMRSKLHSILDFDEYVSVLANNAAYEALRFRFPEHQRLKTRIRYILTRDRRFAVWSTGQGSVCGLVQWNGRNPVRLESGQVRALVPAAGERPAEALDQIFRELGQPVRLGLLVSVLADVWNVSEVAGRRPYRPTAAGVPAPDAGYERRAALEALWKEIRELPPLQAAAILLNLRDGDGNDAVALFFVLGLATLQEIATAAGLAEERLLELWPQLPLADNDIAAMLGLTRQQVINLRKSARERLYRRLRRYLE